MCVCVCVCVCASVLSCLISYHYRAIVCASCVCVCAQGHGNGLLQVRGMQEELYVNLLFDLSCTSCACAAGVVLFVMQLRV